MFFEINESLKDIKENWIERDHCNASFLDFLRKAHELYGMTVPDFESNARPVLDLRPHKLPAGYSILAFKAIGDAMSDCAYPGSFADEASHKIYEAYFCEDERNAQGYLKATNKHIMKTLLDTQIFHMALLARIEHDENTQAAKAAFGRKARKALNHKGRVERFMSGRVPLLNFCLVGENIQSHRHKRSAYRKDPFMKRFIFLI